MESLGTYDAIHVRLGDFGSLCAKRPKFCPPSDAELSRVFAVLDALNNPAPVLLLSDDPDRALSALRNSRVRPVGDVLNASLGEASAPERPGASGAQQAATLAPGLAVNPVRMFANTCSLFAVHCILSAPARSAPARMGEKAL